MTIKRRSLFWCSSFCLLLLCLLLAACGADNAGANGGLNGTDATPTSTIFNPYANANFTLNTPPDWTLDESHASARQYQWQRSDNTAGLLVRYGESDLNAEALVKSGLETLKKNTKEYQDQTIDPQITYHGYNWNQGAASADSSKWVVLAMKDPNNAKQYLLVIYFGPLTEYDTLYSTDFKPMLDSLALAQTHA